MTDLFQSIAMLVVAVSFAGTAVTLTRWLMRLSDRVRELEQRLFRHEIEVFTESSKRAS